MIRENINFALQNKNSVMFITSLIFMAGIMSYFNDCGSIVAAILTLVGIVCILQKRISTKYVMLWLCIFYFGFFNSYFRVKTSDDLYKIAPENTQITGQVVSIPEQKQDKTRFFVSTSKVG